MSYLPAYMADAQQLGFSLKPPKWLRNKIKEVVGQVKVEVKPPSGTVTYGTPQQQTPADTVRDVVENQIPGGWLTVGLAVVAGALVIPRMLNGSRRRNPSRRRRRRRSR